MANDSHSPASITPEHLDTLWFTRCPVPTATGLAYKLGWLTEEFKRDNIKVETLQESGRDDLRRHHYDHNLPSLIREGGNLLAIGARGQGAPSRLVGLTWIDERQSILVRPDSGITQAADLKGKRLALPTWTDHPIPEHLRGSSIARGMSLHGYKGALASAGLTLDDVDFVQVESTRNASGSRSNRGSSNLWALQAVANGEIDGAYVKGAAAVDAARSLGLVVGVDIDKLPERRFRVNNGTPRPITVHQSLIDNHFDVLVRFLEQTLRAAEWAKGNLEGIHQVLTGETGGSQEAVADAYRDGFHISLHPDLSDERLELFAQQKRFAWLHGFLDRDFDLADWVDHRPLEEAWRRIRNSAAA